MWANLWLFIADWFGNHGLPTIAGFCGGLAGAFVLMRLSKRKRE